MASFSAVAKNDRLQAASPGVQPPAWARFFSRLIPTAGIPAESGFRYLAIAGAAAGVMLLFKSNEGVAACVVFYCILATRFWITGNRTTPVRRTCSCWLSCRRWHLFSALFWWSEAFSGVGLCVAFPTGCPRLFRSHVTTRPVRSGSLGLVDLLAIAFLPFLAEGRRDLLLGFLPALVAGFFAFKGAVVRQDIGHVDLVQVDLAVAGLFLLVSAKTMGDRRLVAQLRRRQLLLRSRRTPVRVSLTSQLAERRALLRTFRPTCGTTGIGHRSGNGWGMQSLQAVDGIRVDSAVANLVNSGTVDDIPVDIDIVRANGWSWKPRPVFQSYSAYTPVLDELNARHLASLSSADHIILQWGDIDGSHPLLDDAASWRSLFDHYDVQLSVPICWS